MVGPGPRRRPPGQAGRELVLGAERLVYAGLFAFAPIPVAVTAGTGAVVAG